MLRNLRVVPTKLLYRVEQFTQPKRTTYILERKNLPRLNKLGALFRKKLKRRDYFYELVKDTDAEVKPPIELVLTADVPGIGLRGEKVEMDMYVAYTNLLLPKLALYADLPEAQKIRKATEEKTYSSKYSKIVENYLCTQPVEIYLSNEIPWTLKPWHVKFALRKNGILTNEECITIPNEISGPKAEIENKDFLIRITMNKSEVFSLRCRIYHWSSSEPMLNQKICDIHSPSEALFPDEKQTIDAIIEAEEQIKRNDMLKGESKAKERKQSKNDCIYEAF